jgi:hypothetical protein
MPKHDGDHIWFRYKNMKYIWDFMGNTIAIEIIVQNMMLKSCVLFYCRFTIS